MTDALDPTTDPIQPATGLGLDVPPAPLDAVGPVLAVVGNPKRASRTSEVARLVARRVASVVPGGPRVELIELGQVGPALLGWGDPAVDALRQRLADASALVVASPTYKATYTGLLKLLLDHLDAGELAGLVTVPVMTGAGPAHALALDVHLVPVLVEVGASVPARGLYVWGEQQDAPEAAVMHWWQQAEPTLHRALAH